VFSITTQRQEEDTLTDNVMCLLSLDNNACCSRADLQLILSFIVQSLAVSKKSTGS